MSSQRQPRIFYGWIVVAIAFLSMGVGYSLWYSFTVYFLAVLDEFDLSRADAALAFSVFVFVHGLTGPLAGFAIERFRARWVLSLGAVFVAASLVAASQSRAAWQFYLTFGVITAVAINFIGSVPNYAIVNRWFVKKKSLAFGITNAGIGTISLFALVPFNQYLISTVGWRSAELVIAAIILAVVLPLACFHCDRPSDKGLLPDGSAPVARDGQSARVVVDHSIVDHRWVATDWTMRTALRTKRFWVLFAAFVLSPIPAQLVFVHQVAYFVGLGHPAMTAATIVGFAGLASIPGKVGFGWLSDHIGRELCYTIGISFMVFALLLLLILPAINVIPLMLVFAVSFGLGYAVNGALQPAIAADFFGGRGYGVIFSLLLVGNQIGAALGAWLGGLAYDLTGSYTLAFLFSIVVVALGTVGFWIAAPRRVRLATGPAARAARKASADI